MENQESDQLVAIGEAARLLSVSCETIRNFEKRGQLRAMRVGKFRVFLLSEIQALKSLRESDQRAAAL